MIADFVAHILPAWFMPAEVVKKSPVGTYLAVKADEKSPTTQPSATTRAGVGAWQPPRRPIPSDPEDDDEVTEIRNLRLARAAARTAGGALGNCTNRLKSRSAEIKAIVVEDEVVEDEDTLPCRS